MDQITFDEGDRIVLTMGVQQVRRLLRRRECARRRRAAARGKHGRAMQAGA